MRRSEDVLFAPLDDEWMAIDSHAACCYVLGGVAGRVWELMELPAAVDVICRRLTEEYAVEHERCLTDLVELLGDLDAIGLVELGVPEAA